MNIREHSVAKKYEKEGYKVLHEGAPDFLLFKTENGKITNIKFIEVKRQGAKMTYEQKLWRDALKALGANFSVEEIT